MKEFWLIGIGLMLCVICPITAPLGLYLYYKGINGDDKEWIV